MTLLLDTHTVVWLTEGSAQPRKGSKARLQRRPRSK